MATQAITKKDAESAVAYKERSKEKEKTLGLRLTQAMTLGGACMARGVLKSKTSLYTYEAGGIAFLDIAMLAGGALMGWKAKNKKAAIGLGVMYAGAAPIAEQLGVMVAEKIPSLG